jgi:SanA protein
MFKRIAMIIFKIAFWFVVALVLLGVISRVYIQTVTKPYIFTATDTSSSPVAIVFGAGLRRDGSPTLVLQDRVETAVELYKAGRVKKILMSGDNRFITYNEPAGMREFAIGLGVPDSDIILDYAGRSTYDTCYRAREIFGLSDVILVTQSFHLPRALYTCRTLGMNATGVTANNEIFLKSSILVWNIREFGSDFKSLIELHLTHPLPVLGEKEPIFPNN